MIQDLRNSIKIDFKIYLKQVSLNIQDILKTGMQTYLKQVY